MTDCCNTTETTAQRSKKHTCPVNGQRYNTVSKKTIKHHIKQPWLWQSIDKEYYYCDDPNCEVVYFADDNSIIDTSAVRTQIGIKDKSEKALICYCFGVSRSTTQNAPEAKAFVIEQTKNHNCSCTTSNPSGRCCLKDFPQQ